LLEILYKDEYLVAINKPSGLLVHRSPIDKNETRFAIQELRNQIGQYVYPIHRLDKPTSGVLLFALDKQTASLMAKMFRNKETQKTYIAVVRGYTDESGLIDHAITQRHDKIADKDSSKDKLAQEAVTEYETLKSVELAYGVGRYATSRYSLVRLKPKTGRKHQLRRHMKHISHHILGDTKYGRGEHNKSVREHFNCHRMMLHAISLEIKHPYKDEILNINAPFDESFSSLFAQFGWDV
jgi:tRNA pseudouridine65 synthase